MGTLTLLLTVGILKPAEAIAGASNKGMLTVAILFIVAGGVQATGAIKMITPFLSGRVKSTPAAQFRLMVPTSILSAFLNNTPVVAIFIPAVTAWAKKIKIPVSKLMIPLSYAAILGGTCTKIGTSTNLVVSGIYETTSGIEISFFEIAKVGVPSAIIMYCVIFIKLGAYDYLTKPCEADELVEKIEDAREKNNNNNGGEKSILGVLTNGIRKR